jgi:formate hydrogenlyase subunit 3/multisubunit Na+/H+ antiporter MnhD subunit
MRAICGAIIAAGSLIGLGLLSIGIGTRYQSITQRDPAGVLEYVPFKSLDSALLLSLLMLVLFALIGLAIAFVGLAYHHHHRYHEHLRVTTPDSVHNARASV